MLRQRLQRSRFLPRTGRAVLGRHRDAHRLAHDIDRRQDVAGGLGRGVPYRVGDAFEDRFQLASPRIANHLEILVALVDRHETADGQAVGFIDQQV